MFKTEKAIKVLVKGEEFWLPRSQIIFDDNSEVGQTVEIAVPIWLARDKGLLS
jgi:hypothetical protein